MASKFAGAFDDLVPAPSSIVSAFDDLIPVAEAPKPLPVGEGLMMRARSGIGQAVGGAQQMLGEQFERYVGPSRNLLGDVINVTQGIDPTIPDNENPALRQAREGVAGFADQGAAVAEQARFESEEAQQGITAPESFADAFGNPGNTLRYYGGLMAESAPMMAAAMATRNPAVATAATGVGTAGQTYGTERAKGASPQEAFDRAGVSGFMESGLGLVPFEKALGAGSLGRRMVKAGLSETGTEGVTGVGQLVATDAMKGKDTSRADINRVGIDSAIVGGGIGAGMAVLGSGRPDQKAKTASEQTQDAIQQARGRQDFRDFERELNDSLTPTARPAPRTPTEAGSQAAEDALAQARARTAEPPPAPGKPLNPLPDADAIRAQQGQPPLPETLTRRGRDEKYGVDVEMTPDGKGGYLLVETDASGRREKKIEGTGSGIYQGKFVLNEEGEFVSVNTINRAGHEKDTAKRAFQPPTKEQRQAVVDLVAEIAFERSRGNMARAESLESTLADIAMGRVAATPAPVAAPPLGDIPAESTTDLDAAIDAMLAPTTETAPDGRLGTSAPIAAPPVVGSGGIVDATAAAPDPAAGAVGDAALETGRRPFLTPDDVAREKFTARATEAGLSPEQIAQMTPDTLADDVTGFFDGRLKGVKSGTILRAQEHVEATGEPAFYVDGDIVNLGGLNKAAGENMEAANAHYRAMTDILRAELESTGGDIVPLRTGGDEVGAVVVNAPEPAIRAAMTAANAKVRAYAQANGFGDIPHTKADRTDRGVGLHLGLAPIQPGASLSDIIEASSAEIAASKGGTPDVNGSQTERLGPVAPVGPAGSVGGSVATEAQGAGGQDAARLGEAPSAQGDAQGVRAAPQVTPADQFGPGFDPLPNAEADFAPVGSWVDGPGPDSNSPTGRILYQVRDVPIADLDMPELVDGDIAPEKRKFMPEYERRAASGEQPPNIVVTERYDGTLKVSDGTRRTIAAMRAGKDTIRALVSPSFSESRPAPPPSARPAPKGRSTLRAIAKTIGLDLADFKRHGVDPANFRGSKGSMPGLFRKQGGMTLSRFREWAQENEYLPRDPENAPPTVSDDDALDLFYRMFANEEAVALGDVDANLQAKAEQDRKRSEDRLNADPAAAMQRQRARDIGNERALEALADFDNGLLTAPGLQKRLDDAETYDESAVPFSRTDKPQGIALNTLSRVVRSLFSGWTNAPTVRAVQSVADVPADVRERARLEESEGTPEGFFDPQTETVWLIADAISTPARARWVAYHEVTGHYGIRGVVERIGKGAGSLRKAFAATRSNPTIDKLARAIAFDRGLSDAEQNVATEEALAELSAAEETGDWQHLADRYNVTVPASMRQGIRGAIDRFVQSIKRLFSIITEGRTDAFTDADWRELVAGARRYGREGKAAEPASGGEALASRALRMPKDKVGPDARAENFKRWSNNAPLISRADALTHEFKTGQRVVVEAFHGTKRPDRIGKGFSAKRATSGPMSFFTSDPSLASGYAQGKADTSLTYEDQDFAQWFKVRVPGYRNPVSLDRAWFSLPNDVRAKMAELAPRVRTDFETGENIELADEGYTNGIGNYDWEIKQNRGNVLKALMAGWLEGGVLHNEEQRFMDVLELAGMPMDAVTYDSPFSEFPAVFPTFVQMQRPLVTDDIPANVMDALKDAARRDRSRASEYGADSWDKNTKTLRQWFAELIDNESGLSEFAWTQIPDKVTNVLRSLGYDGIIDVGGKGGGEKHRVYVPFNEDQVKGVFNKGTFDRNKPRDLLMSVAPRTPDQTQTAAFARWFGDSKVVDAQGRPLVVYHGTADSFVSFAPLDDGGFYFSSSPDVAETYADETRESKQREKTLSEAWHAYNSAIDAASIKYSRHPPSNPERLHSINALLNAISPDESDAILALRGKWQEAIEARYERLRNEPAPNIMPAYLSLQNPLEVDAGGWGWEHVMEDAIERAKKGGNDGVIARDVRDNGDASAMTATTYVAFRPEQIKSAIGNSGAFGPNNPSILKSVAPRRTRAQAEGDAEQRRQQVAGELPVSRGAVGWNYDRSAWVGRKGALKRARAVLQDKMQAWAGVQEQIAQQVGAAIPDAQNVYRMETLMHGRVSEQMDALERGSIEPIMRAIADAGVTVADVEQFMYARHAQERNADIAAKNPAMPDGGSGMTNAEAAAILAGADAKTFAPLADRVKTMIQQTRVRLYKHGLISREQFDALNAQYQHYVPLRGKPDQEFEQGGGSSAGRGIDSRRTPVQEALGRGAGNRAQSILGEVVADAQRAIILAEKARVGRTVMRLVLANPNPSLWTVEPVQTERRQDANGEVYEAVVNDWSDPSIVAVKVSGKLYKVQFTHAPLAQALNMVGVDQLGQISRAAGALNRYFSAVLTRYNPAFVPVNAARDALFGLTGLAVEHGEAAALDAALHYPQAARAAFRSARGKSGNSPWDAWAKEFAEAGGKTGYVAMPSVEDLQRAITGKGLSKYSPNGIAKLGHAVADAIGAANDAVENALRLSAYVTLRKRGQSAEAAAEYAKNLTVNFNRKGYEGSRLNAWFLFYNAAMQGAKRAVDVMRKPKTWAYLGGLAAAQTIAAMAAMGMEDEDGEPLWNKVPDHVKRRNLVIVTPEGGVVTIPMPYGFNVFTYLAGRIPTAMMDPDETKASNRTGTIVGDTLSALVESFVPVPVGEGALGLLPTALRIPVNVAVNKDDFGRSIRTENPYGKHDVPRASMGKPDTPEVFKLAAQGLNRIGGGDEYTPPPMSWFDRAPEDFEYLLGELTGGAGKFVMDVATLGGKLATDAPVMGKDVPIAKRFAHAIDEQAAQQSMFYERRDTISRSLEKVKDTFKRDGEEAATAMMDAMPELKGASFRRCKNDCKSGPAGSVEVRDGRPVIEATDPNGLYALYKATEDAVAARNEAIREAYADAPAGLVLPNAERDRKVREQNAARMEAQRRFNARWVADVVGVAE